jgi:hypothetical protein
VFPILETFVGDIDGVPRKWWFHDFDKTDQKFGVYHLNPAGNM